MRLLIEELDERGQTLTSQVVEHRDDGPFRIGPLGCHYEVRGLREILRVEREQRGLVRLSYLGHQQPLTFVESTDFRANGVWLRLSLLSGDVGGKGHCPRCGGSLRQSLGGGAYRSVARSIRSCPACGAEILELADAARSLGNFVDATSTDFFTVVTPHRCPECEAPLKRSLLRTRGGEAQVERCVRCDLLVLERSDLSVLTPR